MKTYEERLNELTESMLAEEEGFIPANYADELQHMENYFIPMTNKLGATVFGSFRINAFHLTDIDRINNIKSIVKQKKALSSFTYMDSDRLKTMSGVRTSGGVIFQLEGRVLYVGNYNLVSYPDNRGKKWLASSTVIPRELSNEFHNLVGDYIKKYKPRNTRRYDQNEKKPIDVVKYIAGYILLVEDFAAKHRVEIAKHAITSSLSNQYNEILIHEIVVKDVLWTTSKKGWVSRFKQLRDRGLSNLDDSERAFVKKCVDEMEEIENELMDGDWVMGDIVHTEDTEKALLWVTKHGGNIDFQEFKKKVENYKFY